MSLNRYAKKRDISEPEIIQALEASGASVVTLDTPCDAICGFRGKNHLVECKTGKRGLNDNQKKFKEKWRGGPLVILRTAEEALQWMAFLR